VHPKKAPPFVLFSKRPGVNIAHVTLRQSLILDLVPFCPLPVDRAKARAHFNTLRCIRLTLQEDDLSPSPPVIVGFSLTTTSVLLRLERTPL
jgi:hypothetical protein